jgi:hypothetical protein
MQAAVKLDARVPLWNRGGALRALRVSMLLTKPLLLTKPQAAVRLDARVPLWNRGGALKVQPQLLDERDARVGALQQVEHEALSYYCVRP